MALSSPSSTWGTSQDSSIANIHLQTEDHTEKSGTEVRDRLPRRDLFVLPLLSFLTVIFLFGASELTARFFFADHEKDSCEFTDPVAGISFRANCTSRTKASEGPWVTNSYNECGYRTNESCGRKPAESLRIALIGSSVAQGWNVDSSKTFANRTAHVLTQRCRRPVEIQNLGREQCSVVCMYRRLDQALALKPDLLMITISPYDIETLLAAEVRDRDAPAKSAVNTADQQQRHLFLRRLQRIVTNSRMVVAMEHFLFQDPGTYLRLYLAYGDKADFLRPPFSPAWQERLNNVDLLLGEMAEKSEAAHVPVVLIEVPNLPQVSAMFVQPQPSHVDPWALHRRLEAIAAAHGMGFVDTLDEFSKTPGSNKMFYLTADHLNADGDALVSAAMIRELSEGAHPALQGCGLPVAAADTKGGE